MFGNNALAPAPCRFLKPCWEDGWRVRGRRRASFLSPFADASHMRADTEMDGIPVEADQPGEAQARLGCEQRQGVITASGARRAIGSGKDRLDLRPRKTPGACRGACLV
jgi:hypothetical protein